MKKLETGRQGGHARTRGVPSKAIRRRSPSANIITDNSRSASKNGKTFSTNPSGRFTFQDVGGASLAEKLVYHPRGWLAGLVKGRLNYPP